MSHTITMQGVKLTAEAIKKAAEHLGYKFEEKDTVTFFDRSVHTGMSVQLPNWRKPVVFSDDVKAKDPKRTKAIDYDNYNGSWGKIEELQKFTGYAMAAMAKRNLNKVTCITDLKTNQLVVTSL